MRRRHRAVHRRVWAVLVVALPLAIVAALVARPSGPREAPAILLAPPAAAPSR